MADRVGPAGASRLRQAGSCSDQLSELLTEGIAAVTNGMAMCKIHHAAYDQNLLGVTPDFEIRINERLLAETDGPMLRHGLQEMHEKRLVLPRRRADLPDKKALEVRFRNFLGTT